MPYRGFVRWWICGIVAAAAAGPSVGAPPPSAQPLTYRRIFLPPDQLETWSKSDVRYLPIDRQEFRQRMARVARARRGIPNEDRPVLRRAVYEAEWEEGPRLRGTARLDVFYRGDHPAVLSLSACDLAITGAQWDLSPQEGLAPAVVGDSAQGQWGAVVERSATLRFAWTRRGQRSADGRTTFDLQLPHCVSKRLRLALPPDRLLLGSPVQAVAEETVESPSGKRWWSLELGYHDRVSLQIVSAAAVRSSPPPAVRERAIYHFSPGGLELAAQMTLDRVHSERPFAISIDPGLRVIDLTVGKRHRPWRVSRARPGDRQTVLFDWDGPMPEDGLVVRLVAHAPLKTGHPWRLPMVHFAGGRWESGSMELIVHSPLILQRCDTSDCRQVGWEPIATPREGESFELEAFSPGASATVLLGWPGAKRSVATATAIDLEARQVAATTNTLVKVLHGRYYDLTARVAPHWLIDSVTTQPSDALAGWFHRRTGAQGGELIVNLSRALVPGRPLRLTVRGRLQQSAWVQPLRMQTLDMLRFEPSDRSLVLLRGAEPFQLAVEGDRRLTLRDPARLGAAEASLLADPQGGLLFEMDENARPLEVALVRKRPHFDARIEATTVVDRGRLSERFAFHCTPNASSVDRLLVQFSSCTGPLYQWSVDRGETKEPVAARRLSDSERAAWGGDRQADLWEITFRHPQTAPFTLRAGRSYPLEQRQPVNLASLVEADRSQARVQVALIDGLDIAVENRRLVPVSPTPPDGSAAGSRTVRAAFRYEPRDDVSADPESPLWVVPRVPLAQQVAWIWKCRLDTRVQPTGVTAHRATYWLQNRGCGAVEFDVPPGCRLCGVAVDGQSLSLQQASARRGHLRITLPDRETFPTITVRYVAETRPAQVVAVRRPLWPRSHLPTFQREWLLHLAPTWDVLFSAGGETTPGSPRAVPRGSPPIERPVPPSAASRRGAADDIGGSAGDGAQQAPRTERRGNRSDAAAGDSDPPWAQPSLDDGAPEAWRTVRWSADTGSAVSRVILIQRRPVKVAAWVLFLLSAAFVTWHPTLRIRGLLVLLGLAGGLSLAAPAPLVVLGGAVLLGTALGIVARWLGPGQPGSLRDRAASPPASMPSAGGGALPVGQGVGLLLLAAALMALAARKAWSSEQEETAAAARGPDQPTSASDDRPRPLLHQVLIPVDADRHVLGNQVYLDEPFLRELYRRDLEASVQPRDAWITAATYRVKPGRDAVAQGPTIRDLQADYDVVVFDAARGITVRLPRDQPGWSVAAATLDGRAVKPVWNANNTAFTVAVDAPGRYRLTVSLEKRTGSEGEGIDVKIPPVHQAALHIATTDGWERFELPTVRGTSTTEQQDGSLVAQLGPADRLVIRPRANVAAGKETDGLQVEEMAWLRVGPGRVLLEVRWRVRSVRDRPRELRLDRSPRLRLLPFSKEGPVEDVQAVPGAPRQLRLQLRRGLTEPITIDAQFLVRGATGTGRLSLPRPRLLGARLLHRRLAVSVDRALESRQDGATAIDTIPIAEFLDAWGDASETPELAYSLPLGPFDWQLVTRPRKRQTSAAIHHDLLLGTGQAEIAFRASLTADIGYQLAYRLAVPETLRIEHVSVTADGSERLARWARADAATVTLFLSEPVREKATLSLRGSVDLPQSGRIGLPKIQLVGADVVTSEYRVRRQLDVRAEVAPGPGAERLAARHDGQVSGGRTPLVARLRLADPSAGATLNVLPNRPRVGGCSVTSLRPHAGAWQIDWDARLEVRGGQVGEIVIDAPGWWTGPYGVSPEMDLEIIDLPSLERRRLVLRPKQPIGDKGRIHIEAPLTQAGAQEIRLPDIRPRTSGRWRRLVRLPKRAAASGGSAPETDGLEGAAKAGASATEGGSETREAGRQVSQEPSRDGPACVWETRGLRPARQGEIPDGFDQDHAAAVWFGIVEQQEPVVRNVATPSAGTPEIPLAEFRVAANATGQVPCGLASFDLLPAGLRECLVKLPEQCRLIEVLLDGRASVLARSDRHRWRLTLGSDRLPQRISVLFTADVDPTRTGHVALSAPVLCAGENPIPVGRTHWTVYGPLDRQGDLGRIGPARLEWERIQQIGRLLERSRPAWHALPAGTRSAGYARWWQRLQAGDQRLQRLAADQPQWADRLRHASAILAAYRPAGGGAVPAIAENVPPPAGAETTAEQRFVAVFGGRRPVAHWSFAGRSATFAGRAPRADRWSRIGPWIPTAGILLLSLAVLAAVGWPRGRKRPA